MEHRHLNHQGYTLAAIDDIILRGSLEDWLALRDEALAQPEIFPKIQKVCQQHCADPYAQRHHFWLHYAEKHQDPA